MRNRSNVLVGAPDVKAAGGITLGDVVKTGGTVPADATSELEAGLNHEPAGFVSEDGVTKTVDRTVEKIRDWNGDTVITVQSDHGVTLQLTFMEGANATVLKKIFGEENVVISGNKIVVKDTAAELPHFSLNIEIKGSASKKIRLFAPDAQITETGDVSFVRSGVIQYQVTIECFDVDDVKLYQFIDDLTAPADPEGP